MIYSLNGTLAYVESGKAVIDCGGVGYLCNISLGTQSKLPSVGSQAFLFTQMNVREDAIDLFGFADKIELEMFKLLTSVNGVGPKAALSILSELNSDRLAIAIASGDTKSITRAQGVGPKLAQRIALELRDKIGAGEFADNGDVASAVSVNASQNATDAVEVLTTLGYSQSEASLAVGRLDPSLSVEEMIKQGLNSLSNSLER